MQYLVTYTENGLQKSFYTKWFDIENNFNPDAGMIVFDLINHKYMVNRFGMPQMDSKNVYLFGCTMFDSGYILATENHTKELKRLNDLLNKHKNSIKERAKKVPKWIKIKVAIRMFFNKLLQKYK